MIREIAREVTALLGERKVPIKVVVDEPIGTGDTTYARERAVVEHTKNPGADRFSEVRSQRTRDQHYFTRDAGYTLTIYAKSPIPDAVPFEHVRRANNFLDQILIALADVAARRKNTFAPIAGGFVPSLDLEGSEVPGGARYVLAFTFARAVRPSTWDGELAPTVTFGHGPGEVPITSTTKVSNFEANPDTSETPADATTSCGG